MFNIKILQEYIFFSLETESFLLGRILFHYRSKPMQNWNIQALILLLELASQNSCFQNEAQPLQGTVLPMFIRINGLARWFCIWHGPSRSLRSTNCLHCFVDNLDIFGKVWLSNWRMTEVLLLSGMISVTSYQCIIYLNLFLNLFILTLDSQVLKKNNVLFFCLSVPYLKYLFSKSLFRIVAWICRTVPILICVPLLIFQTSAQKQCLK